MFAQDLNLEPWAQVMMGGFSEGSNLPASNVYITNCICIPKPYWSVLDDIQWVERRLETARWDAVGRREKAKNPGREDSGKKNRDKNWNRNRK